MYHKVLLTLYKGGRGRTVGALTAIRHTDPIQKCFSLGSVHCSEKKPPEDVNSNPPAEEKSTDTLSSSIPRAQSKTDMPHKEDFAQPPQGDNVMNILGGMKVNLSSQQRFALTKEKKSQKAWEGLESTTRMFEMASKQNQPEEEKEVNPELVAAVNDVASTFPGKQRKVESDLLHQLRLHKKITEAHSKSDLNIKNVLTGMQIKPRAVRQDQDAGNQEFELSAHNVLTGKRLNIFPVPPVSEQTAITESSPTLWDIELAKDIANVCDQLPRNGFEEMIQWTNEGKLWTFPINNEAGLDEEEYVEFHEHIFLDKYLDDFPKQGPIRHFMELVVCGLSKNPYFTVQQKKDHIYWFRDYFNQKEDLLKEYDIYLN